jgi:hypothetical protein
MTREQSNILWVGLFLVVAYVFTDIRVRNLIFGRESVAHPAEPASFTLYNVGSPSSTGNGQSNTGNAPTINGVASPTIGGTATPVSKWWVASFGSKKDVYQALTAITAQAKHPTWTIAGPFASKSAAQSFAGTSGGSVLVLCHYG